MPPLCKAVIGGLLSLLLATSAATAVTAVTAVTAAQASTAWDQPALSDPSTVTITDANRNLVLSPFQDYILRCAAGANDLSGKVTVWGGHNVAFQSCSEYVANPSGDWAALFENQTGTLWVHDVHFGGAHLTGGIQLQEPGATVVLRDVRFDQVNGSAATNHAECVQTWSGPARFLIDGLTCSTTYQGLFLQPNEYGGATPSDWDFRNVDIHGQGAYDLWLADVGPGQVGRLPDFTLQNVYDCDPTNPRTIDGTSDDNQAWAAVRGCPTPGGAQFVRATASGATGPDETSDPPTSDPNELGDPLRYQDTINAATPSLYWRLSETVGTAVLDDEGADNGTYGAGVTLRVPGPLAGNSDTAAGLSSPTAQIQTSRAYAAPTQYTIETWFKAQPGSGPGQIVGMNWNPSGTASVDDHSVYVDASGHVDCYFWSGGVHRLVSPGAYTDGRWHLVQCAKGPLGMTLDVDGALVAANSFTGPTLAYSGYWLIGNRRAGDGPRQSIIGQVGQVAIYGYALSQAQDANHWAIAQAQASTGN
jgi:hypothetical protein